MEVRDGDPKRFGGLGVRRVVEAVNGEIAQLLRSQAWSDLGEVDQALIDLDGTPNKFRLGANALLGISVAVTRLFAAHEGQPLWTWFSERSAGAEIYTALRALLLERHYDVGLGDEGGFAPAIDHPEEALGLLTEAIDVAGYHAGRGGVAIALDPAASEFRANDGTYRVAGTSLSSEQLVDRYTSLAKAYPIWSIEDGLGEDDEQGWKILTGTLGQTVQLVGDDVFVTDARRVELAAARRIGNAALIKPNQIGTLSECLAAMTTCRRLGYAQMVSHRSGDTGDALIADLAVGTGCGQIKAGAPARGERVAKYNRLLSIEADAPHLPYGLLS